MGDYIIYGRNQDTERVKMCTLNNDARTIGINWDRPRHITTYGSLAIGSSSQTLLELEITFHAFWVHTPLSQMRKMKSRAVM